MTEAQRRERAFFEVNRALVRHMDSRSIAIVAFQNDEPREIGSGTCVVIQDRYLIATAAHLLNEYSKEDFILVHGHTPSRERIGFHRSGTRGGRDTDPVDMAWIELAPEAARSIGKEFVPLDRIAVRENRIDNDLVMLSGFPADLIRQELLGQRLLAVQAYGYLTELLPPERWPQASDPAIDLYLDYPNTGNVTYEGTTMQIPTPHGVSGGGIWAARVNNGGVWAPDMAQLVGVEYSWHSGQRWARGVRMQHWLQMVSEDIPELSAAIAPALRAAH